MFKKALLASVVACLSLLVVACGNNIEDACEHMNEICGSQPGFPKVDCKKAKEDHDKKSDADKEAAEKMADCVLDKKTCEEVSACTASPGGGG